MATISNLSIDQGWTFSTSVTVATANATSTLSSAHTDSVTTITVASAVGFPESGTVTGNTNTSSDTENSLDNLDSELKDSILLNKIQLIFSRRKKIMK